jgi:N-acetylglucosaminyldiphosphoundecaprenol N-acetyl-beta-D-mannosaminyltransferase
VKMLHLVRGSGQYAPGGPEVEKPNLTDELSREVYGFLGMPIDALDRNEVVERIKSVARTNRPFLLSTPNVNFLVVAQRDPGFRESLLRSDLCPVDGMPIVWLARLLGIPVKQRVSGSDIFDVLRSGGSVSQPLKVFLFGGADGVAETVCELLNRQPTGMRCVGWLNPGFGTIEEMSTCSIIEAVNESDADLLAVFLSAKKGQAWLLRNHERLSVPTRGQLGATINYQAGAVQRAPVVFQRLGFEWLWRIKEEPYLWRRYLADGFSLARIVITRALPIELDRRWHHFITRNKKEELQIKREHRGAIVISLIGYATAINIALSIASFRSALAEKRDIAIDISQTRLIDPRFYGLLLMLRKQVERNGAVLKFTGVSRRARRSFRLNGFEFLLNVDMAQALPELDVG